MTNEGAFVSIRTADLELGPRDLIVNDDGVLDERVSNLLCKLGMCLRCDISVQVLLVLEDHRECYISPNKTRMDRC